MVPLSQVKVPKLLSFLNPNVWGEVAETLELNPFEDFNKRYLDSGAFAHVYDLGDRVVKFTEDESDYACAKLVYCYSPYGFVKVYDYFKVDESLFCIINEKMDSGLEGDWLSFLQCTDDIRDPVLSRRWWDFQSKSKRKRYECQLNWLDLVADECIKLNIGFHDVHEENVMMSHSGDTLSVKITDFGSFTDGEYVWGEEEEEDD